MHHKKEQGFTLVEILIAVAIIGIGSALTIPSLKENILWSKQKISERELVALNQAIDLYRIENGPNSIPSGANDIVQHEKIIKLLGSKGLFPSLKNLESLHVTALQSEGSGAEFKFVAYNGAKIDSSRGWIENVDEKKDGFIPEVENTGNGCQLGISTVMTDNWLLKKKNPVESYQEKEVITRIEDRIKAKKVQNAVVYKKVYFETSGSHVWIVPEGVNSIEVQVIGGGGSGSEAVLYGRNWGEAYKLNSCSKTFERWDFKDRKTPRLGAFDLEGPFKVTVTKQGEGEFLSGFHIIINGERKDLAIGVEHEFISDASGPIKLEFFISAPDPNGPPWRIKHKAKKSTVVSHHNYSLNNIKIQYKNILNFKPGNGGGGGGYAKKQINDLKGGESVFINIGKGGKGVAGEDTRLRIASSIIVAKGGHPGTTDKPGDGGDAIGGDLNVKGAPGLPSLSGGSGGRGYPGTNSNLIMGAGGSGGVIEGEIQNQGNCGMVCISYKG